MKVPGLVETTFTWTEAVLKGTRLCTSLANVMIILEKKGNKCEGGDHGPLPRGGSANSI